MKKFLIVPLALAAALAGAAVRRAQDACGPFTDVSALYCPYVLEAYYTGISAGTSATTFSPDLPTTRAQSAVFATKALNQALSRGSRRAALGQWWTTQLSGLSQIPVADTPGRLACDGADVWAATSHSVLRLRASDGRLLETWTGANAAGGGIVVAMGRVFVTAPLGPGVLYVIDPTQPAGDVTIASSNLGNGSGDIAFDGARLWTANSTGSISIITPGPTYPWAVTTVSTGFHQPNGILFDGSNIWVTDSGSLFRLDANGAVLQTVAIGSWSDEPGFDGTNLWVPTGYPDQEVVVVSAATGAVVARLSTPNIGGAFQAVFDGRRMLVESGIGVSLYDAASLAPLRTLLLPTGVQPNGGCSDGSNFWISLAAAGQSIARF
jgi:hypothetical protein